MKHIGTTNENEVIIALKIEEINELMMAANSALCNYTRKMRNNPNDKGWSLMYKDASKWWSKLYDLRETIK